MKMIFSLFVILIASAPALAAEDGKQRTVPCFITGGPYGDGWYRCPKPVNFKLPPGVPQSCAELVLCFDDQCLASKK